MNNPCELSDRLKSKWFGLPWPPGFFIPGCFCCATPQAYYLTGGNQFGGTPITDNLQWNAGAWTAKASFPTPARFGHGISNPNGKIYIYGGQGSASPFFYTQTDEYTASGDSWSTKTGTMPAGRVHGAATAIAGKSYHWCGENVTSKADNYQYDPTGDSWATKTAYGTAKRFTAGATINGGSVGFLFCGETAPTTYSQATDEYNPGGDAWTGKTNCPTPAREGLTAYALGAYCYINSGGLGVNQDNDQYDPSGDSWTSKSDLPTPARQWAGGASVEGSAAAWSTGGQDSIGNRLKDHDEYVVDTWTNRTDITTAQQWGKAQAG